jgi:nucleoside phosphorylase
MKRILIIEDNARDFTNISNYLKGEFTEIEIYPTNELENRELKKNIKALFSPQTQKSETAMQNIAKLNFNSYDGIILDYLLDINHKDLNGITVYKLLNLSINALILTKYTAAEFTDIEKEIRKNYLSKNIKAIQKGTAPLTDRQKKEYTKNINTHLFKEPAENELPLIVILTALNEEFLAVRSHLENLRCIDKNGVYYDEGIFKYKGANIARIITRECGNKTAATVQETEKAIHYFDPECMFYVGIAGSRKPNDFKIGDVIIAEKIYSYEGGKATKEGLKARPDAETLSTSIIEIAKKERRETNWRELIIGDFKEEPNANIGIIATGNQLIEDVRSEIGKTIDNHYNDTSAVEMEGYSFAMTAKRQTGKNIEIAVIRGISDILKQENEDENNTENDRRPAHAKSLASSSAAAFTFWIILKKNTK